MSWKCIRVHFWNARQAKLDGKPISVTDWVILQRSNLTHVTLQFTDRGQTTFHCSQRDGMNGCGFKAIEYSHDNRWETVTLTISGEQEAQLWRDACRMADLPSDWRLKSQRFAKYSPDAITYFGPGHVLYDTPGLLSFALKKSDKGWMTVLRKIAWCWTKVIKPNPKKAWCSSALAKLLWAIWPAWKTQSVHIDPQDLKERIALELHT